jgi:hypothetical protein
MLNQWLYRLLPLIPIWIATGRNTIVEVSAPWPVYPCKTSTQVSEFIHEYDTHLFWRFIDLSCDNNSTDIPTEFSVLDAAKSVLPSTVYPFLEAFLGLGTLTPASQFHHVSSRISDYPCGQGFSYAIIDGVNQYFCSYEALTAFIDQMELKVSIKPIESELDRVYNKELMNSLTPKLKITLNGIVGSQSFCGIHKRMVERVHLKANDVLYAIRHSSLNSTFLNLNTPLQGYGVFLDIKNMEYKTVDDSAKSPTTESETSDSSSSEVE